MKHNIRKYINLTHKINDIIEKSLIHNNKSKLYESFYNGILLFEESNPDVSELSALNTLNIVDTGYIKPYNDAIYLGTEKTLFNDREKSATPINPRLRRPWGDPYIYYNAESGNVYYFLCGKDSNAPGKPIKACPKIGSNQWIKADTNTSNSIIKDIFANAFNKNMSKEKELKTDNNNNNNNTDKKTTSNVLNTILLEFRGKFLETLGKTILTKRKTFSKPGENQEQETEASDVNAELDNELWGGDKNKNTPPKLDSLGGIEVPKYNTGLENSEFLTIRMMPRISKIVNPEMDVIEIHYIIDNINYREEYNISTKYMKKYKGSYSVRTTKIVATNSIIEYLKNIKLNLEDIVKEFTKNAGVINISGVKYQLTPYNGPWDNTKMVAPASSILKGKLGEADLASLNYVITKFQ